MFIKQALIEVLPDKTQYIQVEHIIPKIESTVESCVEDLKTKRNIWMVGKVGTGKTTAAFQVIMRWLALQDDIMSIVEQIQYTDGQIFNKEGLEKAQWESYKEVKKNDLRNAVTEHFSYVNIPAVVVDVTNRKSVELPMSKIVVIDELGWPEMNEAFVRVFNTWIEERYGRGLKQIITTNFSPREIVNRVSGLERSIDRLTESVHTAGVKFSSTNLRHVKEK